MLMKLLHDGEFLTEVQIACREGIEKIDTTFKEAGLRLPLVNRGNLERKRELLEELDRIEEDTLPHTRVYAQRSNQRRAEILNTVGFIDDDGYITDPN